jgi:hypothetical protein
VGRRLGLLTGGQVGEVRPQREIEVRDGGRELFHVCAVGVDQRLAGCGREPRLGVLLVRMVRVRADDARVGQPEEPECPTQLTVRVRDAPLLSARERRSLPC